MYFAAVGIDQDGETLARLRLRPTSREERPRLIDGATKLRSYVVDADFGPLFIKFSGYFPYITRGRA